MAECSKRGVTQVGELNKHVRTDSETGDPEQDGVNPCHGSSLVDKVFNEMVALTRENITVAWNTNQGVIKSGALKKAAIDSASRLRSSSFVDVCYKIEEKGRKQLIKIQTVEPLPPMNYWIKTPINIPTPDSKYLTHIPYMGEHAKQKKNKIDFSDELLGLYNGRVHSGNDFDENEWLASSEIINMLDFIRVLMEVNKKYGDTVFSDEYAEMKCIDELSAEVIKEIYSDVLAADENVYLSKRPSSNLATTICIAKFQDVDPNDLMKYYDRLSERRNSEFSKPRISPRNIDGAGDGEVYTKDAQMDSYRSMFCRICYKYACPEHTLMMSKDEISTMQSVVKLQSSSKRKSSTGKKLATKRTKNKTCDFKDCCKNTSSDDNSSLSTQEAIACWNKILAKWSSTERTVFNCHYESFEDYCIVASLLSTKTCRQVMEYHKFSQLVSSKGHVTHFSVKESDLMNTLSSPDTEIASSTLGSSGYESASPSGALNMTQEAESLHELCSFVPCCHSNGICDEQCTCVAGKKFCEASCGCFKSCKNRSKGCVCLTTCDSKRCPCYIANRECDPDLCKKCRSHEIDIEKISCKNVSVQRRLRKPIYVAKSKVSGLGAFAGVDISKGEFIDEYRAEMISTTEADRRGYVYDQRKHTFLFDLSDHLVLDASRFGNSTRFINSSKRPNCQPIKMSIRGEQRLAIRAIKDIKKDEELFFNYHEVLFRNTKDKRKRTKKYLTNV